MSADPDLTAIEARAAAASQGPWRVGGPDNASVWADRDAAGWDAFHVADTEWGGCPNGNPEDAAFIAHARTDVPALVARIRELEAENAKIDDLDEALRQRDREILGLRRELAKVEGDG